MRKQCRVLRRKVEARGLGCVYGRDFVEEIGKPHKLAVVREVEAGHRVVYRLVADIHLLDKCLLGEVQKRCTDIDTLVELILQVEAKESLALGGEHRLVFERNAYILPRVDNALIGDCDYTHSIIYGIIGVFGELHATSHDYHGAARTFIALSRICEPADA